MTKFITLPIIPTVKPALPANVYIPLTAVFIVLYGLIFVLVYLQLVLILYYKHKRFSYQTAFLFLSLIWSSLRIVLFSFYFKNAEDANKLFFVFYFCLYCLPVVLQFSILCLLVLYYGQVYFKIATRATRKKNSYILRFLIMIGITCFAVSSILTAYYTREICLIGSDKNECNLYRITLIRVLIDGALFLSFGGALCAFLFRLAKISLYNTIPEQNNITVFKATSVSICCSFLLITRTVYNLLAISSSGLNLPDFGFDWLNVSDQADLVNLTETDKFVAFGVIILIWELIPTSVVLVLFRLKINFCNNDNHLIDSNIQSTISVFIDTENNDDSFHDDESYLYSYQSNRTLIPNEIY